MSKKKSNKLLKFTTFTVGAGVFMVTGWPFFHFITYAGKKDDDKKKEEIKKPIRQSVRELLARNRVKAEAANAARLTGQGKAEKKKQKDRDK